MCGYLAGLYLHAHVSLLNRTPQEPRAVLRTIQPLRPEKKSVPGRAGAGAGAGPGRVAPPPPARDPPPSEPAEPGRAGTPPPSPAPAVTPSEPSEHRSSQSSLNETVRFRKNIGMHRFNTSS
jgi:hypothetical protein